MITATEVLTMPLPQVVRAMESTSSLLTAFTEDAIFCLVSLDLPSYLDSWAWAQISALLDDPTPDTSPDTTPDP